ncbi:phage head closure protein [Ectobacillus ponti]|uniref:Phage head closure protein n=1 Tax=Ectobacillus ponti TaxID=2961894 RepID=A0AA41XCX4_9BACI|nr:phage head closure protein [Ectobacillus ponti]MCP8970568.1 phage head closure protein [Ectobacillus ponti]
MNPGLMRERITVQKVKRVNDGIGGSIQTWVDVVTTFAQVVILNGLEDYEQQALTNTTYYKIITRYRSTPIDPFNRIVWRGRLIDVNSVLPDAKRIYVTLMCQDVKVNGE